MKKIICLSIFLFKLISFPCLAILPPFWEGVAELKMIMNDERLKDYFSSGELIESITKMPNGYLIVTNRSKVLAEIRYFPQNYPGPAKFEVKFHTQR